MHGYHGRMDSVGVGDGGPVCTSGVKAWSDLLVLGHGLWCQLSPNLRRTLENSAESCSSVSVRFGEDW
jgi:hypothetical protein